MDYFRIQIKAPDSRFSITIAVRTGRFLFLFQEEKTFFSYIISVSNPIIFVNQILTSALIRGLPYLGIRSFCAV